MSSLNHKIRKEENREPGGKPREPIAAVLSNPFGGFAFEPVLPCSAYTVTARHRFFSFGAPVHIEPKNFPPDGSGVAVTIVTPGQKNLNKAIALLPK